jgi:hypothetical protein
MRRRRLAGKEQRRAAQQIERLTKTKTVDDVLQQPWN